MAVTVYGGNKTHGVSAESLIVKTVGSSLVEACRKHTGDPLTRGKELELSTELSDRDVALARDSLRGAPMRTSRKLAGFSILR